MSRSNLIDVVSARFPEMQDKSVKEIVDFLFDEARGDKRGLSVDVVLSTSAKMINKRIYRPSGHIGGLDSWTKPYKKPILVNHNENSEPMGRIRSVEWRENPAARKFFATDKEYKEFRSVIDFGTPKEVQKIMNRYRLLKDKNWPGLGDLVATLDIKDRAAAEKILDERYLTFSQSSDTDSYACGECGADRMQGQKCQHRHGTKDKKGDIPVLVCGNLYGKEVSVVNTPANDTSVVFNISFEDSENGEVETVDLLDLEDISYEATYNDLGEEMKDISEEVLLSIVEKVAARLAKPTEQEPVKPAFNKLDGAYQKRFKATRDSTSTGFALVEDTNELVVHSVEDIQAVKEMLETFDCAEELSVLKDRMEQAEAYFTKTASDEALKSEIQTLKDQLEAMKEDYARLLAAQTPAPANSQEPVVEKNEDSSNEGLDGNGASAQNVTDQEPIENPSESGTPSLNTSDSGKTALLADSRLQYYVGKYRDTLQKQGEKAAKAYVSRIKAAGYVSMQFDPSLYI